MISHLRAIRLSAIGAGALALALALALAQAAVVEGTADDAQNQIAWVESKGGYFSPKLEFRRMFPDDPNSPSAIFSTKDIVKGEVVMTIPRSALLTSGGSLETCDTVRNLVKQYKLGDKSEYWPYVKYVMADRHKGDLPSDWSDEGKDLIETIIPKQLLGDGLDMTKVTYDADCGAPDASPLEQFAHLNVLRRSWDDIMIPVFDMVNHRNGRWRNVESNSAHEGKDIVAYALRDIATNEQLYISYNECTDCEGIAHTYVVQHLLRDYGFVEQYPQRWSFYMPKVTFEVDELDPEDGEDGHKELKLTWLSDEPDFNEKYILHGHLQRLENMRTDVFAKAKKLASKHEQDVMLSFFNALVTALDYAVFSLDSAQDDKDAHADVDEYVCSSTLASPIEGLNSSRPYMYSELTEIPYVVEYMTDMCDFSRSNNAHRPPYEIVGRYESEYQKLQYYHSHANNDTCLYIEGVHQMCTSNIPHYHEVAIHYAASYINKVERVVVLGGGDNMVLDEIMKYTSLKLAVLLELDQTVTRSSSLHFGVHPHWNDERVQWWFGDAAKSLPILPRDYYGSFDLVVVDLQTDIVQKLDIMNSASNLVKPEGIIVRNECEGFGTRERFSKYSVDLYNDDVPLFCVMGVTIGSNVDLFSRPWKPHANISTLYYHPTEANRFDLWYNYRKIDDTCTEEPLVSEDDEIIAAQTSGSGVMMILEAEDIRLPLNSATDVQARLGEPLKEAGLTELSFEKSISRDNDGREGTAYTLVFTFQEGYVVARVFPEYQYCAFDLLMWSRFDRQDIVKNKLGSAVGSKFSSSYRIVTVGMYGTATWQQDREKIGPPPHTGTSRSNRCYPDRATTASAAIDVAENEVGIVFRESMSLLQDKDAALVVLCGKETRPCTTLELLSKDRNVMPVWTCPNITVSDTLKQAMYACKTDTLERLYDIVATRGKLGGIALDPDTPREMGQVMHKIFSSVRVRRESMRHKYIALDATLNMTDSSWRRAFLDSFRTEFVKFSPAFVSEIHFGSTTNSSLRLGIFSSRDKNFYSRLVNVMDRIETKTGLTSDVSYVKNGLNNYIAEFKPSQVFSDSDYSREEFGYEKQAEQVRHTNKRLGGQTIFQFLVSKEYTIISSAQVLDAIEHTLRSVNSDGMSDAKVFTNDDVGDGCVVGALWSKGNILGQWDGMTSIALNIFTQEEPIQTHNAMADQFMEAIPSRIVLRDDQPRGIGSWLHRKSDR